MADITDLECYQFIAQLDSQPGKCDSVFDKDFIYFYVLQETASKDTGSEVLEERGTTGIPL